MNDSAGFAALPRRRQVVVIGGGFAGLSAVRSMADLDVDVLLVDRNPFTTFQPLLYQVATGGLNPGDVTSSLRSFVSRQRNARFRRAEVRGLEIDHRQLLVDGDPIGWDWLVVCCGVDANWFGTPGAAEHARVIYSRSGAIDVRDQLLASIEDAAQGGPGAPDPVVVIVGGGATGVELAGTIAELFRDGLPVAYPELDPSTARVILVEMQDHLLAPFSPRLQRYAERALRRRGVDLRLGTTVAEVRPDSVVLGDGTRIEVAATIWAAGVASDESLSDWGLPQGRGGRILTDPDLRVRGNDRIFAVGDVAVDESDPLAQLAQPAIQGGRHVAQQIGHLLAGEPTDAFAYNDKGIMATIGRSDAVVQLPSGLWLTHLPAWLAWVGLHIITLMTNRNRLATMVNLGVRYLAWPGSIDVIVGESRDTTR